MKLTEIKKRLSKTTPGPWKWIVNKNGNQVLLCTTHSGEYYVMDFERWGFHGAQPVFQKYKKYEGPVHERESLGMVKMTELLRARESHHPTFNLDIDHPDAQFIANAPADIKYLLDTIEEQQREIKELCDKYDKLNDFEQTQCFGLLKKNGQLQEQNKACRDMLKKLLQVTEGFDYRANINFTLSDCIDVEMAAKATLKAIEGVEE